MAIQLNAPNFPGIQGVGNAQISVPGALGLQAYQAAQAAQANAQQNALGRMQVSQQDINSRRAANIQQQQLAQQAAEQQRAGLLANNELAFKQQQLGQQNSQFNAGQALDQQKLAQQGNQFDINQAFEQRKLDEVHLKDQMAKTIAEGKQAIQEKGAFASYALLSMKGAKSPEEAQQIRMEILKEGVSKGYYTPEQAKQAGQLPISQFNALAQSEIVKYGVAKEHKDLMDAQKEKNTSGTHVVIGADGSVEYTQDATKATQTEAQKDIKSKDIAMQQFKKIEAGYDPDYFTYKGQASVGTAKFAEKSAGIPGLEQGSEALASALSGKNKEERAAFIEKRSAYMNSVDQVFNTYKHEITGAAAGEKELEQLKASFLNGDMSPSEFKGSLEQIVSKYKSESDINKKVLKEGISVSPQNEMLRSGLKAKGYSDQEIDDYLKSVK